MSENTALYSCSSSDCAEEWSFPESMLFKMSFGNPYCIDCLGPFENPVPWKSPETLIIDRLKAQNAELIYALERIASPKMYDCANWVKIDHIKEFAREAISAARESHE